jgi:hypothetical protein
MGLVLMFLEALWRRDRVKGVGVGGYLSFALEARPP